MDIVHLMEQFMADLFWGKVIRAIDIDFVDREIESCCNQSHDFGGWRDIVRSYMGPR